MELQVSLGTKCKCQDPSLIKGIVTKCWCKQHDESSKPLNLLSHVVRKPYYKHPFKVCAMPPEYMVEVLYIRFSLKCTRFNLSS